jgi:hypothetical protein
VDKASLRLDEARRKHYKASQKDLKVGHPLTYPLKRSKLCTLVVGKSERPAGDCCPT